MTDDERRDELSFALHDLTEHVPAALARSALADCLITELLTGTEADDKAVLAAMAELLTHIEERVRETLANRESFKKS